MNAITLIPANNFIWNQDQFLQFLIDNQKKSIVISTNGEGVCLSSTNVYQTIEKFNYTDVKILTNNLLETHPRFQIEFICPFSFFQIEHSNYTQFHIWNQNKIFGCLYNRPLWFRLGLCSVLQHDYSDATLINMRSSAQDPDQRSLFEIAQLFNYHPESFVKFSKVVNSWPIRIEDTDGYTVGNTTSGHTDQLAEFYTNFLIDIVAETWVTGQTFSPTEKTVRPMLLKKPMIIMGPKDYMAHLRQMGFRTFADFWNEEYDGYEGLDRYIKILELIDQLATKSLDELEQMYWDMQYTLDYNYNLLLTQNYNTTITHIK